MDFLNTLSSNTSIPNDPIFQMLLQSKENKDLALNFLDQEGDMEDFKNEFINFYTQAIEAFDNFYEESIVNSAKIVENTKSEETLPKIEKVEEPPKPVVVAEPEPKPKHDMIEEKKYSYAQAGGKKRLNILTALSISIFFFYLRALYIET